MARLLPINLDVSGRLCVVAGGGSVARRKAAKLASHGARVRVIAAELKELGGWPEGAELVRREVALDDVRGAFLVVAATGAPEVNRRLAEAARAAGALAQQVDAPDESDFSFPATLRRGDLSVSFSTDGASPAFASWLRDRAARELGAGHAAFCELARTMRREAMAKLPPAAREPFFHGLVEAGLLELLTRGEREQAYARARGLLGAALASAPTAPRVADAPETPRAAGRTGRVYLVGAGPGDAGLITMKGAQCLRVADVVLHDGIVNPALLDAFCPHAERIDVSKRKGHCERTQNEILALLIQQARLGRVVVRLKGGDPLVFGRGGEEARALRAAGLSFELVPGVSCVSAVPAYAGIPITDREYASSFGAYSAHRKGGLSLSDDEWRRIAGGPDTLVFLMGKTRCTAVVEKLIEFGRPRSTPIALIFDGTSARQRTVVGTLETIVELAGSMKVPGPGLIVVGEAVRARSQMAWFEPQSEEARDPCREE
ncbi:MAG: uroporphyrinogen-III C-methyltransferase [Myxococcaceae bacterium]